MYSRRDRASARLVIIIASIDGALFSSLRELEKWETIQIPANIQIQIVGAQTELVWYCQGDNAGDQSGLSGPIFKLNAPSHVVMRDFQLFGQPSHYALGEGIVAEVTYISNSRVTAQSVRNHYLIRILARPSQPQKGWAVKTGTLVASGDSIFL